MTRNYECLDCGAYLTAVGARIGDFVDDIGLQKGCSFCGSLKFKPVVEQVIEEEDE